MNKYFSYINTAVRIIDDYQGAMPFKHHLKQFFSAHKKYGSRDRKQISHLCYCFYRLGWSLPNQSVEERIKAALFLCNGQPGEWKEIYNDTWLQAWVPELCDRISFINRHYSGFTAAQVFPWQQQLSESIDADLFAWSHLIQPDLFLRARPGKVESVKDKLTKAGMPFLQSGNAFRLSNASKADTVLETDREAVIQDLNSQRTAAFLQIKEFLPLASRSYLSRVWDCCAASGGKSILAIDTLGKIDLHVSDNRPSIIYNLRERFKRAGVKQYQAFVADLTDPLFDPPKAAYDLIIADLPCTGSGTWARTPEQLCYFSTDKIAHYSTLQQKILLKISAALKPGGRLLFITCSVFRQENEEMVAFLRQQPGYRLEEMKLLKGYEEKADTLFAARFIKEALPA